MALHRHAGVSNDVSAAEDLTGKEGLAVKITSTGIALCDTAGEEVYGILIQGNPIDRKVAVAVGIQYNCIFGATVALGAKLMTNASAKLITRTAGNAVVGFATEAGALNEERGIDIRPQAVLA